MAVKISFIFYEIETFQLKHARLDNPRQHLTCALLLLLLLLPLAAG
jgi:hypothetical protein